MIAHRRRGTEDERRASGGCCAVAATRKRRVGLAALAVLFAGQVTLGSAASAEAPANNHNCTGQSASSYAAGFGEMRGIGQFVRGEAQSGERGQNTSSFTAASANYGRTGR